MILGLFEIISSSLWFLEPSEISQVTRKNNPPISLKLWAALWDRRGMKSRGGGLCLECLLLLSFNLLSKPPHILSPRKMINSSSEGVRFFWTLITHRNFFLQKFGKENFIIHFKNSSFLQFLKMVTEFEYLQKILSSLLRVIVIIWLWKNFGFFMREKKLPWKSPPLEKKSIRFLPRFDKDFSFAKNFFRKKLSPKIKSPKTPWTLKFIKLSLLG